jgi:hypothetical protein
MALGLSGNRGSFLLTRIDKVVSVWMVVEQDLRRAIYIITQVPLYVCIFMCQL